MINVRQGVFHLRNEEASYLFRVKDGFLEHLHFGARAETADAPAFAARPGCGWGDSTLYREGSNADCLDILPLEWSGCGRGDYRESPLELSIGGRAVSTDFRYLGCEVLKEPPPSALPVSRGQTILAVYLEDAAAKLRLTLLYGVLPTVFTRRAILENCGSSAVHIRKCMSACTELPGDWELHTFSGGWIAEVQHTRTPVTLARTCLESTTGASSSRANPGFLLAAPDAGEQAGAVYGFNLLYSGSHYLSAQKSLQGLTRVLQGISPANFDWELAPGARFETPEAVMAYSGAGFGGLSACFHRYVNEHLIPPDWQGRPRPIVYNSWEGCMFDFTESKLLRLGRAAKQLGCELFVLDDGWFGKRNSDTSSLGDYTVNEKKLPGGLRGLGEKAERHGIAVRPLVRAGIRQPRLCALPAAPRLGPARRPRPGGSARPPPAAARPHKAGGAGLSRRERRRHPRFRAHLLCQVGHEPPFLRARRAAARLRPRPLRRAAPYLPAPAADPA